MIVQNWELAGQQHNPRVVFRSWPVRQLAGMGMTQNRAWGWAIDQRRHGEGQSASELRVTVGQERGRDRKERGTHHMETWNKDDLSCYNCWLAFLE